ncbi:beta-galactosidase [Agromyces sp. MMS24-K17]|uniref:beta-galactosidase n=1 Tax=Agromyces sp. MMS24-K17 TaxID=3372850 RepID=UPI003754A77D
MSSPTVRRRAFDELTAERGILFGGDYNPEQWPRETWREDVELMQRAGVTLVTVGVFSWAMIEPRPGAREFGWLDEVLDLLHGAGIAVDLATPTASPPPWLGVRHPEILPVDADGVRLVAGSRNQFSPSSTVYREHARAITRDLAARYAGHPAVRMWHVGNEFGQVDFGDEAAREFRRWLAERYGTIDALNEAWATTFWSQRYDGFDEILPPRRMPYVVNPTQSLDFRRFSSDQLLRCYTELRDAIRDAGATQPVTTNLMGFFAHVDAQSWAAELDVIADDQYPDPADPHSPADIALVQDLMRSLGDGRPWLLMEQAVSATSWRAHNLPKTPARARLDSLQAVARGADGICFFQWRQSRAGAERFHSAMLPNAGADTDVFAGVVRQGADLRALRPVVGTTVPAEVAVLFDWTSWWAGEDPTGPTDRLRTLEQVRRWYRVLWRRGVAVDVVAPGADLSAYRVVLAPHSYVIEPDAATGLRTAVEAGAQLVVGPFSGVADANGHLLQGRSPVLLRDLLGVSGEEWGGLPDEPTPLRVEAGEGGAGISAATGEAGGGASTVHVATILAERLRAEGAEVRATFAAGPLEGRPAVTRHAVGTGAAWYLGTVVDDALLSAVLGEALDDGVRGALGTADALPDGLEAVRRGPALFLLNHGHAPVTVTVPAGVVDLLTNETSGGSVTVAPGDVHVLMERRSE